jgi:tetratricopeptide (TPR) repeat protein
MKLITTTALALVTALAATPATAQMQAAPPQPEQRQDQQAQQPKITPSKGAMKALTELQDAVNKNDYASVPAKVAAAEAVATTKQDHYLVGQMQLKAALAAKDKAGIAAAIDRVAASGVLDSARTASLYVGLGGSYYNDKQYAPAAAAYQKALTIDPRNSEAVKMVGESLFAAGQKAEAAAAFQRAIQASVAAGQKPEEALLKRAVAVAYEAQSPTAVELARQWVAAYPSGGSWSDALAIYSNLNHPDAESALELYRLRQVTGALTSGAEYAQFARTAAELNNFNEAQAVLDAGIAAKAINPSDAKYNDLVSGLKTKPKATAADLAAATKSAQSGMALLRIGDRYYAMGDYAKAVELYKMSMSKPGVDAGVANLHIGMALAKAGDKAGATSAFNAVTGPRAEIAKFWLTYLNQKA